MVLLGRRPDRADRAGPRKVLIGAVEIELVDNDTVTDALSGPADTDLLRAEDGRAASLQRHHRGRSSVRCAALMGVRPPTGAGSVQRGAARPTAA